MLSAVIMIKDAIVIYRIYEAILILRIYPVYQLPILNQVSTEP